MSVCFSSRRQPVFTVKLDRGDNAGFYSFGYIDTTVTTNPITYTPVDKCVLVCQ
jgi:hypothetical protein